MIRNNIIIIIALFCICFSANAQSPKCNLLRKTFYYVTFDIRSKTDYPVIMNGVTTSFSMKDLNMQDKNTFIGSFYKKLYYTPELVFGYKKMLLKCMGDSSGYIYLKNHSAESSLIGSELNKHSLRKKFILESGETVYLNIVKISANFWKVYKTDSGLSKNSNEMDITDIKNVDTCYVPFKVFSYKKPTKSTVFN